MTKLLLLLSIFSSLVMARPFGPGGVGEGAFSPLGAGTFSAGDLSTTTTGVTVGNGTSAVNGSGTTVDIQTATGSQPGLLSAADWATFNAKQATLTLGNLTSSTTGLTVTSGTGVVVGSGTSVSIQTASGSQPGLLSAADWTTFNAKQATLTLGNLTSGTTGVSVSGGTNAVVGSGASVSVQSSTDSQPGLMTAADHAVLTALRVGELSGHLEAPTDKTFTLDKKAAYAYTINTLDIATASGTATVAVKINGTSVTGISAVSVSSVDATGTATAANSVAAGDKVTLVVSSGSSPVDMAFTLKYTR